MDLRDAFTVWDDRLEVGMGNNVISDVERCLPNIGPVGLMTIVTMWFYWVSLAIMKLYRYRHLLRRLK